MGIQMQKPPSPPRPDTLNAGQENCRAAGTSPQGSSPRGNPRPGNLSLAGLAYDPQWGWKLVKASGAPSAYSALEDGAAALLDASAKLHEALLQQDVAAITSTSLHLQQVACRYGMLPLALAAMSVTACSGWLALQRTDDLLAAISRSAEELRQQLQEIAEAL